MTPLSVLRAKRYGANYALRIYLEAKRAGIPYSLGLALIEQESNFKNVFGHDPVRSPQIQGGSVTKSRYRRYKHLRRQGYGMQGVGPAQLTYYTFQDDADRLGGCWKPKFNIRVAFSHLAALIKAHGERDGIRRYNGSGPAADRYASSVLERKRKWHRRVT